MPFGRRPSMCSCEEGKKSLNDLESRTSIGRFSSDLSASTAVKGLNVLPPIQEAQTQHCPKEPRLQQLSVAPKRTCYRGQNIEEHNL